MFTILGALSQMERELIAQRVRAGLANARAMGKHIGRKKTRPSELIRALLKKNMKYREISSICNCSHGSINAERKEMLKDLEKETMLVNKNKFVEPDTQPLVKSDESQPMNTSSSNLEDEGEVFSMF